MGKRRESNSGECPTVYLDIRCRMAYHPCIRIAQRILAVALVIVTVLPILVFATDFTSSRSPQRARQGALERGGVPERRDAPDTRRERIRVRRAMFHPTVATMVTSMGFQLVMITVMGVVGRRLFTLQL